MRVEGDWCKLCSKSGDRGTVYSWAGGWRALLVDMSTLSHSLCNYLITHQRIEWLSVDILRDMLKPIVDAAATGGRLIVESNNLMSGACAYAVCTRCCAACRERALELSGLPSPGACATAHRSFQRVLPRVQKNSISSFVHCSPV
jgi:hypothetical protein